MKRKTLVLGLTVLASTALCWAADEDVDLEKIVVTPSKMEENYGNTSRKVDVITGSDIESTQAEDVGEVLTDKTSVDMSNYGGPGTNKNIRMRGSTAAQVLIMVDGRPVNSPRDGQVDLSTIPLDNISRVELLHGPASSLYGSAGMGGAVNIITKNPPKKGQKTEAYSSFGNNHTFVDRLSQGARLGKFGYLVSGGYESSGGFRPNSEFNSKDINTKFEYALNNDNNLFLNSGFYKSRVGSPGSINIFDKDDKQVDLKNFFDLYWDFTPDETTGLKTRVYNNHERLEFIPNSIDSAFESSATTKSVQSTDSRGLDIQLNKQLFDKYHVLLGFNYIGNFNNSTSSSKHRYIVRAWYMDNQFNLTNDLRFSLGARVDDYSNFGSQVSPNASLVYNLQEDLKIRTSVSRSFRAPTFNDLYWPNDGFSEGNPNLRPEKGITAESGIEKKFNKHLTTGLTYYWNHFTELINWAPDDTGFWRPINIGSATINGIELENKISFTDKIGASLNYTYMIAKDTKTHKFLIYQPQDKVDFSLKYDDLKGFLVELKGQYMDRRFNNTDNTESVKRFVVFGLNTSKKITPSATYFLNIDNLLNRKYQVQLGYPMPGCSFTSGLKLEF